MIRTLAALAATISVIAAAAAPSEAATIRLGFGEQDPSVFSDARFRALKVKRVRVFVPWNVALRSRDRAYLDGWLAAARTRRVEPLVSFNPSSGSRCPKRPCTLPSVRAYTRAFRAFRKRYRSVRVVSPWNEANHRSQPTFRHPKRAAQYYNVVRRHCRGCKIIAADVIDETNMERWLRVFKRYAKKPRLWGLHNYRDTNPRRGQRYGGTRRLLRAVRGQVWLTETGGIVRFVLPGGKTLFPRSESRANRAVKRMFSLAKRYRGRIKRLYVYHWRQSPVDNRFDAGVVRADGSPRPSYTTVRRYMRSRLFAP